MDQAYAKWWLPADFSTHGATIDALINFLHWFMLALFIGWGIFMIYCIVKFRRTPGGRALYHPIKAKLSKYIEIVVVGIEVVLLFALSIPLWDDYKTINPEDVDFEVRIIGQQYKWNAHYAGADGVYGRFTAGDGLLTLDATDPAAADDILLLSQLYLPYGGDRPQRVKIDISSIDVLHSFFIPVLRIKQDAVPGMRIPIWVEVDRNKYQTFMNENGATLNAETGLAMNPRTATDGSPVLDADGQPVMREVTFEMVCAQLCGLSHYNMKGLTWMVDVEAGELNAWMRERFNLTEQQIDQEDQ